MPVITALWRLRKEDLKIKVSKAIYGDPISRGKKYKKRAVWFSDKALV
jgi:hypothetical protein